VKNSRHFTCVYAITIRFLPSVSVTHCILFFAIHMLTPPPQAKTVLVLHLKRIFSYETVQEKKGMAKNML
jgi:hypothetical protein